MNSQLRGVWTALLVVVAVIVGALIGFTTWGLQPAAPAAALGAGIAAFFSTAALLLGLLAFVSHSRP